MARASIRERTLPGGAQGQALEEGRRVDDRVESLNDPALRRHDANRRQRIDAVLGLDGRQGRIVVLAGQVHPKQCERRELVDNIRMREHLDVHLLAGEAPVRHEVHDQRTTVVAGELGRLRLGAQPGELHLRREDVVRDREQADHRQRDAGALAQRHLPRVVERQVDGADRDAGHDQHRRDREERRRSAGEVGERRHHVLEVVERGHEQRDPEHALDRLHPGARLRQPHGEPGDRPERHADPDRVRREQEEAGERVPRRRDERQDARQGRPGAGRRDQPADEPHQKRAAGAAAADAVEPMLQPRRQPELERAEHRRRHQREEQREGNDHPRIGQERAERLADQREHGAERSEHHRDTGDVEGRQQQGAGAGHALAAEDADGDRNHRIHAGRERRQQAGRERKQERARHAAAGRVGERGRLRGRGAQQRNTEGRPDAGGDASPVHEASAASATSRFSRTLRSPRSKPSLT